MRRRAHRGASALLAFAPFALYACGALKDGEDRAYGPGGDGAESGPDGSGDAPSDVRDAGDASDAGDGTPEANDAHRDANADSPFDGAASSPIPLALGSSAFRLIGFTNDGLFVYQDGAAIYAVPTAGGARSLIFSEPADSSDLPDAHIEGNVVFVTPDSTSRSVVVWSLATGPHTIPPSVITTRVSADGTRIAYKSFTQDDDGGYTVTTTLSDVDLSHPLTFPGRNSLTFSAEVQVARDRFVVQIDDPANADLNARLVDSYTNAGLKTHLFNQLRFAVAGDEIITVDANQILARTVDGGPIVTLAAPGDAGGIDTQTARITPDGRRVIFADTSGQFWSSPTSSAAVVPLPATTISNAGTQWMTMAPDGAHFMSWLDGKAHVASTTAGNAITVLPSVNGGRFSNDPAFSLDGRYAFLSYNALGELVAVAVDTGASTRIALDVDCTHYCWAPTRGSTLLYAAKGDLFTVDAALAGSPTKIATSVTTFRTNTSGTMAVYLFKDGASEAASGLFAIALP